MLDELTDFRNIVAFADAGRATLRFPEMKTVETYWDNLRGPRQMPLRSEVDPRGIGRMLDRCFVLERLAPGVARFRLAGSHLNALQGMDARGMPLTTFFLPQARHIVAAALQRVFDTPAKAWITLSAARGLGKPPMDGAMLLLPMQSDTGAIDRIIGCLATLGPVGRAPRRFDLRDVQITPLSEGNGREHPIESGWMDRAPGIRDRAAPDLIEGPAACAAPRPARVEPGQRPHLYLVNT
ncbi:PAS domain-containing protein [Tropicimonas sp. IMCC34043]|uniref:PAS domain-containing protein n=1 Tax=Tropicimonas sp. IMCC34043 TaxID=2248760 RepID=UPI000E25112A|nr:PAS domain-containing protein [Tropicimonas sp. IMCC34043]